ncbi:MAG: hypothetical protein K5739_06085 [Lachnospiraceae bacterium]|nr:hypothetical protein [Lachnospiraceae bacterium]
MKITSIKHAASLISEGFIIEGTVFEDTKGIYEIIHVEKNRPYDLPCIVVRRMEYDEEGYEGLTRFPDMEPGEKDREIVLSYYDLVDCDILNEGRPRFEWNNIYGQ